MRHLALVALTLAASCARGVAAPAPERPALAFSLNDKGLAALNYNGQPLLAPSGSGGIRPVNSSPVLKVGASGSSIGDEAATSSRLDAASRTVRQVYSWGTVSCAFSTSRDALRLKLRVSNTSATDSIAHLDLQLGEFTFPAAPTAQVLDAGMWGNGVEHPLEPIEQKIRTARQEQVLEAGKALLHSHPA